MTTAVMTAKYIVRVPGRRGFYFQRRTPADLRAKLGKITWRWKLSDELLEARRLVLRDLLLTDKLIAEARGDSEALSRPIDQPERTDNSLARAIQEQSVHAADLYPKLSGEDAEALLQRQVAGEAGKAVSRSLEELIDVCQRRKQPAPGTLREWNNRVKELQTLCKVTDVCHCTEKDARKYRDHMLSKCAGTTTKARIKSIKAMFNVACEEGWIASNPWNAIVLKRIKASHKKKEAIELEDIDKKVESGVLDSDSELVYWICRLTATDISEASGMAHGDIDLKDNAIHIRPNELRGLKVDNEFRERTLPITPKLRQKIEQLYKPGKECKHIWTRFYDQKQQRWGNKIQWQRKLGISLSVPRKTATTTLKKANINDRVISAILGHRPQKTTDHDGAVSIEMMREALKLLESNNSTQDSFLRKL